MSEQSPGEGFVWNGRAWIKRDPTPEEIAAKRAAMTVTRPQLIHGLVTMGWITNAEGLAWIDGDLPEEVSDMIATLPASQRLLATARAKNADPIYRMDPMVIGLAAARPDVSADDLDSFFTTFAQV